MTKFKIGADPEFVCTVIGGSSVVGGSYLAHNSLDAYRSEIGCDGNGATTEVRPEPSEDPLEVVANIHDILLRKATTHIDFLAYNWHAGSCYRGYPLGGHIHFGVRDPDHKSRIIHALGCYLAPVLILLEEREDALERRECDYGLVRDQRSQPWGVEYRFPSSWIASPYVAAGVLTLAKAIAHEVVNNNMGHPTKLIADYHIHRVDTTLIRSVLPKVWEAISKLQLYSEYKQYIDVLRFLNDNKLTWEPKAGMKEAWGIVDMKKVCSKPVSLASIWNGIV